ncbi:transketolase [Halomonas salipaludis]|uniref:Transketolase n=1 Tax=Halomonas salipaludis TaxID=2032625 RepID=A0A2A2F1J2_9GAMM|nr:transketolase [Halomonas salipaludis]PAU78499.1 transketolase [Halomonas salipaludis]
MSITVLAPDELARKCRDMRTTIIKTIGDANMGHIGGDLSVIDILGTLYFNVLNVNPAEPTAPNRDRFILSKGHCAVALYTTMAHAGYFPVAELATFIQPKSRLNGHPCNEKLPGVETSTGPLGHGLPVGVGAAIGAKIQKKAWQVFVVVGDGEIQEGSNWEAAMTAAHKELDNLTLIVDRNRLQQGDRTHDVTSLDPLAERFTAFGWEALEVDGHDYGALIEALKGPRAGKPRCIVANTLKGKGVSFIEDRVEWHHKVPSPEQVKEALNELERGA